MRGGEARCSLATESAPSRFEVVVALALTQGACACGGTETSATEPAAPAAAVTSPRSSVSSSPSATEETLPEGAVPSAAPSPADVALPDPGYKAIHRLNTAEYNATVEDVLGTTFQPANANWRGGELGGFDNIATVLGVDEAQYARYFEAAQILATEVFASEELRTRFVSCDASQAACVRTSIESAGLRLLRRPLAADEVATYERVYDEALELGDEPLAALELAFRALLSSAEFLFRIEVDPQPDWTEPHPLSGFELASRLSYFLWSSAPDDELLLLAADESLQDTAILSAVVDRMLDDPRSERLISNFSGQWLGARQVISHPVAPQFYNWSPEVARAARDEMLLYFSEFFRNERSWFEFPTADINFIDGWLALLYGMPTPLDSHERVEYVEDERAGFFGLAGFLAVTSFDRRTSPSLRGRWIANNLLCMKMPDPPPDVPKLPEGQDASALNVRQALELHRQNPTCAACHELFDAYGLALEEYDAIGQHRSEYPDGTPVEASGTLPGSAEDSEGRVVQGLDGLASAVATDPQFARCLTEKLFTYGLGRLVTAGDAPYLEQVEREWAAAGEIPSVRRLIRTLIESKPFRFRRGDSQTEESL